MDAGSRWEKRVRGLRAVCESLREGWGEMFLEGKVDWKLNLGYPILVVVSRDGHNGEDCAFRNRRAERASSNGDDLICSIT